ncbi:MAG TPA: HlyD family efflux transporter periplasmic adaptor subunit [Dongiaceae bacterium]|nr:HlyD family efflux transporter periplasmic adaptor subunit [Dongiaceae bacterium]
MMKQELPDQPEQREPQRRTILWISLPVAAGVAILGITLGTSRMKSAAPIVDRAAIRVETVVRGPLVQHVQGLGVLVPEETRVLAAATEGHVDQLLLRPGSRVKPETVILQLSNPDLERQLRDADLATKKSEAELANLRVQLQAQLLNERALEAQLQADATQAGLEAERDEALLKQGVGTAMSAKISRARADSLATRLQIEKEKLAIAEEARQAQLAAKQAEVAQVQALLELRTQQKESLLVRAGIAGVLDEVSVAPGQQVTAGANLARVTSSERLMARIRVPASRVDEVAVHQKATIGIQNKRVLAHVARIEPMMENGAVNVELKVDGAQPAGARSDLSVDGSIEVNRDANAIYLPRAVTARANQPVEMFKLSADGSEAVRVAVDVGRVSEDGSEITNGLQPGDRVIVSDMSTWNRYDRVRLQ